MTWVSDSSFSRRTFLAAAAGMAAPAARSAARWALLSDTHIPADPAGEYRGFKPYENLKRAVRDVDDAAPGHVLVCGDLARLAGLPGDYRNLHALLSPLMGKAALALALGNHDDRTNFLAVFGESAPAGRHSPGNRHVAVIEGGPVRLIALDSLMMPNFTPGFLGKSQRSWLAEFLETAPARPTLLAVHHTLDDGDGSRRDAERLLRIATPVRSEKAIFYGHSHNYRYDIQDGLHLINLPALGYNFRGAEPVGWVEAALSAGGGDFKLHALGGNTAGDGKTISLEWRS